MYFILFFLLFFSCHRSYLSLSQEKVDARYLASTHVNTPDPRQKNPPIGQRIIMSWWIPQRVLEKKPHLDLHLIYWDNTENTVSYPLRHQAGSKVYFLLGEEFQKKRGILTYKAEIITTEGEVFTEWQHQLWVELIQIGEEDPYLPPPLEKESPMNILEEIDEEEESDTQEYIPLPIPHE